MIVLMYGIVFYLSSIQQNLCIWILVCLSVFHVVMSSFYLVISYY
ncbi:hypothetical protein OIU74_007113 [Salix koriyanagi]|uniref:Uncharacterized protein n=1 Tax=Salix koriyanagi TaxID=2511006 RepID=A0A9Q0Z5U0_9ROSI|nr:hypothetical protein OIU74_007113 [Salix koriyanagi]